MLTSLVRALAAVLLGLALASTLSGQAHAAPCDVPRADTLHGIAYGNFIAPEGGPVPSRAALERALAELSMRLPDTVRLRPAHSLEGMVITALGMYVRRRGSLEATPVPLRTFPQEPLMPAWAGYAELATEIELTMRSSGALGDARVITPGDSGVAGRLLRAIAEGATEGGVEPRAPGDSGGARLILRLSTRLDSLAVAAQPLLEIEQVVPASVPPFPRRGNHPPRYPDRQATNGVQAVVLVWFDVDERGHVVRGTVGVAPPADPAQLQAYRPFMTSAEREVRSWRFYPGTVGGCPARQRVVMSVRFVIGESLLPQTVPLGGHAAP